MNCKMNVQRKYATFILAILKSRLKGLSWRSFNSFVPVLVVSQLLSFFCYFVSIILLTLCSLLCLSVFQIWSGLDYFLLIFDRILVPLITLLTHAKKKHDSNRLKTMVSTCTKIKTFPFTKNKDSTAYELRFLW